MCKKTIKQENKHLPHLIRKISQFYRYLGFSLIELLFTITIISILCIFTLPVYRHLLADLRLFLLTERIRNAINYARSEAIRRQNVIVLCKSKDRKTCSGKWNDGWIVIDKENSSFEKAILLRTYPALSHAESVEWRGSRSYDYLQLDPNGGTNKQNGSFIVCVSVFSKKTIWLLKISQTGRLRIEKKIPKNIDCNF